MTYKDTSPCTKSAHITEVDASALDQVEHMVDSIETPQNLREVVYLLSAASKLIETAAYGAARSTDAMIVTDLLLISARLDAKSQRLRKSL